MNEKKVYIIGSIPPPIGGVTIHTMRLLYMLKDKGVDVELIDLRRNKLRGVISLIKLKINIKNNDIIHYQLNNWVEYWFISKLFNNNKFYTVHSFRWNQYSNITKKICKKIIEKEIRTIYIAPTETIKKILLENGFKLNTIKVLNTYLPAIKEEYDNKLPDDLETILKEARLSNKFLILSNAYKIYLDNNGNDVYGIDSCIEVCRRIKNTFFVFCAPQYEQEYYEKCVRRIHLLGIGDRFVIYSKKTSLIPIFKQVDLFIRPTITDSYGISVEEALDAGIPSVASNVCERANGTILYENGNIDDLCGKITAIMEGKISSTDRNKNNINKINEYLNIYDL